MKLAEALIERKALKTRLASLLQRLMANVAFIEGTAPEEDAQKLFVTLAATRKELQTLVHDITTTNATTLVFERPTTTMCSALIERDTLKGAVADAEKIIEAIKGARRYNATPDKTITIALGGLSAMMHHRDQLATQLRKLDADIQRTNWLVDLLA